MKVVKIIHKKKEWYGLSIEKTHPKTPLIKQHKERVWSQTLKMWLFPISINNETFLKQIVKNTVPKQVIKPSFSVKGNRKDHVSIVIRKSNYIRLSNYPGVKILELLKAWKNCRFYSDTKFWMIPYHPKRLEMLKTAFELENKTVTVIDERLQKANRLVAKIEEHQRVCPKIMVEKLEVMRYSFNTIKTYTNMMAQFLTYYHSHQLEEITTDMIKAYLRYLVMDRKVSLSFQNQAINAIKFYYEKVLGGQQKTYFIDRPKKERKLPEVLSKVEVVSLLKAIKNLKHKAIISTIYSGGLRISEVINLKLSNIDFQEKRIHIKAAKGKKDRYVPLAERSILVLKKYIDTYSPLNYLFEGSPNNTYSTSSIQKIVKTNCQLVGITKHITPHSLRHSFATHMIESGVNLRYVQQILGHQNSKTTEIYTHITDLGLQQITNPLDILEF